MFPSRNLALALAFALATVSQDQPVAPSPEKPSVIQVQVPFASLKPIATFDLGGDPDWLAISANAIWVANDKLKSVQRIDPRTNKLAAKIEFPDEPCSDLTFAFDTLWVPLCGKPATLARIDPATNTIRQKIAIPPGSFNPLYGGGIVWITGNQSSVLTPVNARSGEVLPSIPVGPNPRFVTAGAGSIWTLNQGDGSVTRVDAKTRQVIATIPAGIPGHGGEIAFGASSVWATVFGIPLTQISPTSNKVIRQWTGSGGDSVRFGHHSLWLTHLRAGLLWRIAPPRP